MEETMVLPRPDWWRPGMPLPPIQAIRRYTGKGKLRSGGKVVVTDIPVRWETLAERANRGAA